MSPTQPSLTTQILSQKAPQSLQGLRKADQQWTALKNGQFTAQNQSIVKKSLEKVTDWDSQVVICGGTLGILLATALQKRGISVILVERGTLRGREQEWNISRQELTRFVELGLLTEAELETVITSEYNPARVAFHGGCEVWVEDVLNTGVYPVTLLEVLKQNFLNLGGNVLENHAFVGATVHPNGVTVETTETPIKSRLLVDAMGHFSPLVREVRQGEKPEGVCLVVGSCAEGYPRNETGDLIVTFTPIEHQCQYFWEAFPAKDGRSTYLFTYLDAHPDRFSLEFFMDEYFRLLPEYQQVELEQLHFHRFLFGFFPAYKKSPLQFPWPRILPVGDSSGSQSPVSFGGFGAMVRHLPRLTEGITEALESDCLGSQGLNLLQPYQPNISTTWLFQRTMSVGLEQDIDPQQINELLSGVFRVMDELGDEVLRPFLQDVVQFSGLSKTLPLVNPKLVLPIIPQVGIPLLADWLKHYVTLGLYSSLYPVGRGLEGWINRLSPQQQYYLHRWLDAWEYGSGKDYDMPRED
ncbi:FAD-binding oxidoreductase [Spirulina sp. CS-785/01]|uniref:NAD(P)/FAD-dependent oxidoreductase n=1 Tax=Spirulina sp. CS-785/01 TaxID=3021716 RepID=UPI002330F7A1|nr:FAD-binding oxidoreductase [Spirulina sp. CS-785/01]MDB9312991.1 FAD-binding oxidoreductase [Spirulina sp. CS-785/01]